MGGTSLKRWRRFLKGDAQVTVRLIANRILVRCAVLAGMPQFDERYVV